MVQQGKTSTRHNPERGANPNTSPKEQPRVMNPRGCAERVKKKETPAVGTECVWVVVRLMCPWLVRVAHVGRGCGYVVVIALQLRSVCA